MLLRELPARLEALGARFTIYLLTFLGSQLPCVLRHVLVAVLGPPSTWVAKGSHMYIAICVC